MTTTATVNLIAAAHLAAIRNDALSIYSLPTIDKRVVGQDECMDVPLDSAAYECDNCQAIRKALDIVARAYHACNGYNYVYAVYGLVHVRAEGDNYKITRYIIDDSNTVHTDAVMPIGIGSTKAAAEGMACAVIATINAARRTVAACEDARSHGVDPTPRPLYVEQLGGARHVKHVKPYALTATDRKRYERAAAAIPWRQLPLRVSCWYEWQAYLEEEERRKRYFEGR